MTLALHSKIIIPQILANRSLVKYLLIVKEFGGWQLFQRLLQVLRSIADRHGSVLGHDGAALDVSIAMVAISYILGQRQVKSVIIGAHSDKYVGGGGAPLSFLLPIPLPSPPHSYPFPLSPSSHCPSPIPSSSPCLSFYPLLSHLPLFSSPLHSLPPFLSSSLRLFSPSHTKAALCIGTSNLQLLLWL